MEKFDGSKHSSEDIIKQYDKDSKRTNILLGSAFVAGLVISGVIAANTRMSENNINNGIVTEEASKNRQKIQNREISDVAEVKVSNYEIILYAPSSLSLTSKNLE